MENNCNCDEVTNIPSNEEYTKPEEISALKKFLGHVKSVLEEHTTLGEDNLRLPSDDILDGNIDNLLDHLNLINLDENSDISNKINSNKKLKSDNEINNKSKINLDQNKIELKESDEISLKESISKLINNKNVELDNSESSKIKSNENFNELRNQLDDIKLKESEILNLSKDTEKLDVNLNSVKLNDGIEHLKVNNNSSLNDGIEHLKVNNKIDELNNIIVKLLNSFELVLKSDFKKINSKEITELCDKFLELYKKDNITLNDSVKTLRAVTKLKLLNNSKLNLKDNKSKIELLNTILTIQNGINPTLNTKSVNINKKDDNELYSENPISGPSKKEINKDWFNQRGINDKIDDNSNNISELNSESKSLPDPSLRDKGYSAGIKYLINLDSIGQKMLLTKDELNELNNIQKYVNLSSTEEAAKFEVIQNQLNLYTWGLKFIAYLLAILSKNSGFKNYLPKGDVERLLNVVKNGRNIDEKIYQETGLVEPEKLWQDEKTSKHFVTSKSGKDLRVPKYKLPEVDFNVKSILNGHFGIDRNLRYNIEKTLESLHTNGLTGYSRLLLIDSLLAEAIQNREYLEKYTRTEKYRLPGMDRPDNIVQEGIRNITNITNNGLNGVKDIVMDSLQSPKDYPLNTPLINLETGELDMNTETIFNIRSKSENEGYGLRLVKNGLNKILPDKLKFLTSNSPSDLKRWKDYFPDSNIADTSLGIGLTLKELLRIPNTTTIPGTETKEDGTVTDVKIDQTDKSLKNYNSFLYRLKCLDSKINNSSLYYGDDINHFKTMTLDSNHIWEVELIPYLGPENGYISYLPPFKEINTINKLRHGYYTNWSNWIPFISYEVNTRKMLSKSLGLFDGEISYPSSLEFTNDLRLTLVDDLYKSWRTYFENVMKHMICLSRPHTSKDALTKFSWEKKDDRLKDTDIYDIDMPNVSKYIEGIINPAPYKNVTFRCKIYSMTPLLSTVRKFDLLVILKDFQEIYLGEVDAGAGELSLNFSIVGENPEEVIDDYIVNTSEIKITNSTTESEKQNMTLTDIVQAGFGTLRGIMSLIK